ncbi:UTP--glucose-1-phosphate uridylyltransferase [Ruminococcus flavefaciens]|uniref:UDP-N-acetylglucosamine/UDP-N-acetylgalactosamine diphosphorylase n=1 Tax=Ruminococcus flavefaciens TaxID=1265 RepID=A0A1M7HF53_RUMFL|nr:UDPGP type 1 family protein [Ruminococcus flavefaciens]SHM26993.1 UDP-N-acetylglucosamine/UDP-N-acetylgalactosaminediphosphorylase [Ruminococcus flavefaciens]
MINRDQAARILKDYGQEHILKYFDELSENEKQELLSQIEIIDFSVLDNLDAEKNSNTVRGKFEPLGAVTIEDIASNSDEYISAGVEAIKNGKAAAVLLAGGQGTRLGFDKPKGMFNIGVEKELYIFQCLINNLMDVVKLAGAWVPLYIMTSEKNHKDTTDFFKEKNYFGYAPKYVHFFIQDMAPSVDFNGKILMESKSKISISPNGNGGWFSSLVRAGLLDEIKANGVEWINVFAVDNVLQRIADPGFIGAVIKSGLQSGGKVVSKASPDEKVGVLCLEDGMPSIVEYYEMTEEMRTLLNEKGELAYKYGVILNYLFNVKKLEEICDRKMPVHVVDKKIPYMNENGELVKPTEPNGHKFETLVLDMVHMQDSCLAYEVVREKEFAPVKNATGVDSVESARELLEANGIKI